VTPNYAERCGAKSAKPEWWELKRYPACNRPAGHHGMHREYDPKTAHLRHEWWEALEVTTR
jgi:hypothetical protein